MTMDMDEVEIPYLLFSEKEPNLLHRIFFSKIGVLVLTSTDSCTNPSLIFYLIKRKGKIKKKERKN